MNIQDICRIVEKIDPANMEYILKKRSIIRNFERVTKYKEDGREDISASVMEDALEEVRKFKETYLTPANVKIGDGVTVNLWSDRHAATIIKVTPKTVTVQRDTAILSPDFKPEWITGGFSAHCTNQNEQSYTYERNEKGEIITFRWSDKYQTYGTPGNLTLSKGRHEFYDYNF